MLATQQMLRAGSVILGILAALLGAIALTLLAIWVFDQSSPDGAWGELGAACACGILAAACAQAHHRARAAARQREQAESLHSAAKASA